MSKENNIDFSEIQKITEKLRLINNKYESIEKATGNNYNIFQVLGIETKEVITHSRMIADLINPQGWHGMGSQFLLLFLDELNKNLKEPIDTSNRDNVECTVEKNYGSIDYENTKGGNIDILLTGLDKPLVIENKINAGDQPKQLLRYYNNLDGNCHLLYLTLFGNVPSKGSTGEEGLNIRCISYTSEILTWLEKCHELAIERPLLRETLKQYLNIIKHLTGQSMNDDKNNEVYDLIEEHKTSLGNLHIQMNNFINNRLTAQIEGIVNKVIEDSEINYLAEKPRVYIYNGAKVCCFKIGHEQKGVVFELSISLEKLSLFTNAWRWDSQNYDYGEDKPLVAAMEGIEMYRTYLNSTKTVEELTKQVIAGIKACKDYYDKLLKSDKK